MNKKVISLQQLLKKSFVFFNLKKSNKLELTIQRS